VTLKLKSPTDALENLQRLVWSDHTTGGLVKADLTKSKWSGKIISKKKQQSGKALATEFADYMAPPFTSQKKESTKKSSWLF